MKSSTLIKQIADRFKAGALMRPIYIKGSPGVGKSEIIKQAAKNLGVAFMEIHAPLMQPEDYGMPIVNAEKTDVSFAVPTSKFPLVGSQCPDTGILALEEIAQTDNSGQKILANLMLAREIHGKKLKDGWLIVATGNKTTDRAGANELLSHLKDRATFIELEVSLDDWCQWALENGVKTEVIAHKRFRPELLSAFDQKQEKSPTPRAWTQGVSAAIGVVDQESEFEVFKGDIGEGAAADFLGFLKMYRKLPSVDAVILNPTGIEVPSEPDVRYAICGALAEKTTGDNFGRIMSFISRLPEEFHILFVRDAVKRNPDIQNSADVIRWFTGDGKKLLT